MSDTEIPNANAPNLTHILSQNEFLHRYLRYVEINESPYAYHAWAALSAVAAAIGRRGYIKSGHTNLYPNMYILLMGPPASKKSTAINIAQTFTDKISRIRLGPSDIGGYKQGLLGFMAKDYISVSSTESIAMTPTSKKNDLFRGLFDDNPIIPEMTDQQIQEKGTVYICASEFSSIAGENRGELLTALTDLYDCKKYTYYLKQEQLTVEKPAINILGGCTPTQLSKIAPATSLNDGFMARMILVYEEKTRAKQPRIIAGDQRDHDYILSRLEWVASLDDVEMTETTAAAAYYDKLYMEDEAKTRITDQRLQHYMSRRYVQLRKLSMLMALASGRVQITLSDLEVAENLLAYTEASMHFALAEYGNAGEVQTRQAVCDYLKTYKHAKTFEELYTALNAYCPNRSDFTRIVENMLQAGRLMQVDFKMAGGIIVKKYQLSETAQASSESSIIKLTERLRMKNKP